MFDNASVTVLTASSYYYRRSNLASVLVLTEGGEHEFNVFGPLPENVEDMEWASGV